MPIQFDDVTVYDTRQMLSIEDAFRLRGVFAGIHKYEFDSLVNDDFSDLDGWTDPEAVWAISGGGVEASATATGNSWQIAPLWSTAQTRASFKVIATLGQGTTGGACILFRGNGQDTFYFAQIDADRVGFYKSDKGLISTISELDPQQALTWPGTITVGVYQDQYSEYAEDRYLFMSIFLDDRLLLAARDHIPGAIPGFYWGLGIRDGYNVTWRDARIPDLSDIVTWSSLDPSESASGSLARTLGDRVVTYFVRHNDALRAFRPKESALSHTFTRRLSKIYRTPTDRRQLYSHVRLYYATGDWVEVFSPALYKAIGHRFIEVNNQDIVHEDEAYREAGEILRRMEERASSYHITAFNHGYLLEPGDRISLPDGNSIVDTVGWSVEKRIEVQIRGRKYAY